MSNKQLTTTIISIIILIVTTITISLDILPITSACAWVVAAFIMALNILKEFTNKQ